MRLPWPRAGGSPRSSDSSPGAPSARPGRTHGLLAALLGGGLLALALWALSWTAKSPRLDATLSTASVLAGADTAGYARAVTPRPFSFPRDHGPHPEFRSEWWYFTGNLAAADGRRFGYQLTIFRSALSPRSIQRASPWATRQAYMAHFALTDAGAGRFHAFDRFERGALGLAGARAAPFRVWLDAWDVRAIGATSFPVRLSASEQGVSVDFRIERGKPPVPEGDAGLSRKGPAPGDASYYYSLTRMPTRGIVRVAGDSFRVSGESWMDREWSTSALGPDDIGWDWFALQLADGRDLMLYRIRHRDGTISPFSAGTIVALDGTGRALAASDFDVAILDHWTSPASGVRYPSAWRVRVPSAGLDLRIRPLLADQELDLGFRYWEGAVTVAGTDPRGPAGRGYVELTGYGRPAPRGLR